MISVQVFAFNASTAADFKARITEASLTDPFKFTPSDYQQAIFEWIASGNGSLIVRAVAGSGKTTTMVMGLRFIPGLRGARDVSAKTFHSAGFGAICKKLNIKADQLKADGNKVRNIAKATLSPADYDVYADFSVRLVALAKGQGIGCLEPDVEAAWYKLVQHHDLYLDDDSANEKRGIDIARQLLWASNDTAEHNNSIDYDDMLYLPLLWRCRLWQNDWVIVDEAQDTNPVRRAIAKLALRPGGRLIAVGDDKQAIYGFTGASHDALDLIKSEFNCQELSLNVSYRCPVKVAAKVRPLVPHFTVPDTAIWGEVRSLPLDTAMKQLGVGDVILCRQTSPLVELAFALFAKGIGCHLLGREIGAGLVNLIKRQKGKTIEHLLARLEFYQEREIAKHMARGEEGKAESVADRVLCIKTVIGHLDENRRTIPALIERIESMFNDNGGTLVLSTIHKVKGREYRRVAILRPDLMPSKWARQDHQYQQELNLMYVAWTRAMETLIELTTDRFEEEKKPAANCTYPRCKCIVSTSTSQPEPVCPLGLHRVAAHEHVWVTDKSGLIDTCACGEERA